MSGQGVGWQALYPWEPRFLDVDGGRMAYVDVGAGAPILCVHGNPTWGFYWRRVAERYAPARRVLLPDHLGCGRSDKPQAWPYRLSGHVDNLERLVLALDLRDITLVVHDWGGAIGLGVAGRHPERFARLVITNTAAFPAPHIPARIAVCRVPGFGALAVRGLNGFAGAAVHMATEKGLAPDVRAGLLAPYGSWADRIATLRFVEDIPMAADHPSRAALEAVAAGLPGLAHLPTALVWGMKDWCFTPWFLAEFRRRFPAAAVIEVADAGHYVMEDAPEAVLAAIAS